jgi:hypothetical protein
MELASWAMELGVQVGRASQDVADDVVDGLEEVVDAVADWWSA